MDNIFSPLDGQVPPIPHQELRLLRESFADSLPNAPLHAQPMYQTAVQLCDTLLLAVQERESASVSLADSRSKAYSVVLSQNKKKEAEDKRKFFEFTIVRRWSDNSKTYRDSVVNLYGRLRNQERDFTAALNSSLPEQSGETIVLQHPTSVRRKYGSAMLPAGLTLHVVERTASGVIVDYAGERVSLPPQ